MKYGFRTMKIGDIVWFPRAYSRTNMAWASTAAKNFAKKSGNCTHYKFRTKKVYDEKKQREGIQIKRVK